MILSAKIVITRTSDQKHVKTIPFKDEAQAQDAMDLLTMNGNDESGIFKLDLIAMHSTEGELLRRTRYNC